MDAETASDWISRTIGTLPVTRTPVELIADAVGFLHEVVDFDACANSTLDPESMLPSGGAHIEGFPPSTCGPYWDAEYLHTDVMSFGSVHRAGDGAQTLHRVTDGHPERSRRHTTILRPLGLDAQLRATCTIDGAVFGMLDLVRAEGLPDFSDADLHVVDTASTGLAVRVREAMACALSLDVDQDSLDAAVVILDEAGAVLSMTATATAMLDLVPEPMRVAPSRTGRLHGVVHAIWARARFLAAGFDAPPATARIQLRDRRWMTLRGTCTRTPAGGMGHTVVVLEPTLQSQLGPLVLAAHELTPREGEIVSLLLRGDSAQQISSLLGISIHTVRTHVKRVHEKMGISSRAELTRLFIDEQFLPTAQVLGH